MTLRSQSPAEHRCGVGTGPLGSVRMGTSNSQAEQRPPTLPSRGSPAPHPDRPAPQQATPTSALWAGRRRLRKHGPLDRRVLGLWVLSQPRGARGQECRPGPCLLVTTGPAGLKHYSLEHSTLDFLAFQKRSFYKYLHRNIRIGGFLQDPPGQQVAGANSAF